jgi:hypothetical protein
MKKVQAGTVSKMLFVCVPSLSFPWILTLGRKDFTILAADIDPSLVDLLKKAKTLEELLVLIKKANLDGSDCGRVQVIPGQWIVHKKIFT